MAGGIEFGVSGFLAATVRTSFAEVTGVALGEVLEARFADPFFLETDPNDFPNPRKAAKELKALVAGRGSSPARPSVPERAVPYPMPASRPRRGALKRISDEKLVAILETVKGNRLQASVSLVRMGITLSDSAIFKRIDQAPEDSPFAKFKALKGRGRPLRISDADLARVLEEVGWVQTEAARRLEALGIVLRRSGINKRIGSAKPGSPLYRAEKI